MTPKSRWFSLSMVLACAAVLSAQTPPTEPENPAVKEFTQKGDMKVVKYRFWWFVGDYEGRNRTRDEVFGRISAALAEEDLKGTEVTLA